MGDYKHLRQNDITVGGNAGVKVEYTWGRFYGFDISTIFNGKLYSLFNYKEYPANVPETVRLANKVVESFSFQSIGK